MHMGEKDGGYPNFVVGCELFVERPHERGWRGRTSERCVYRGTSVPALTCIIELFLLALFDLTFAP